MSRFGAAAARAALRGAAGLALALAIAASAGCAGGGAPRPAAPPRASVTPAVPRPAPPAKRIVIDDFDDIAMWSVHPAEGVEASIAPDSGALRLDLRFARGAGYAVIRRKVDLDLPADYVFRFRVRGEIPNNHLEFKLIDASDQNVWWHVRRDLRWPKAWTQLASHQRQIRFAWGPAGGGEIRHVAAIEFAVTAGEGGQGSVWLDDLALEDVVPDSLAPPPVASASSERPLHPAALSADRDTSTWWATVPGDTSQWLALDLGRARELGGLVVDWQAGGPPPPYAVDLSLDGQTWTERLAVAHSNGGLDPLYLPESEARFIRLRAVADRRGRVMAVREITLEPVEWSATPETFFASIAHGDPRGAWPRAYLGEQSPWAVIGADGARDEALLSLDGTLEAGKRRFSIEPLLYKEGRLVTWADVVATPSLTENRLPLPAVRWRVPASATPESAGTGDLTLDISAFAPIDTSLPWVYARYRLHNEASTPRHATLYLAVRPFQVNPPWQAIGAAGGVSPIRNVDRDDKRVRVNGETALIALTRPSGFAASDFGAGEIVERMRRGPFPREESATDPQGFASAVLAYAIELPAGGEHEIDLAVALRPGARLPDTSTDLDALERRGLADWRAKLDRVNIAVPAAGQDAIATLEAQLGWILVNRDGPSIQPGSRNYDRSWIRDGSLTSSALLRLGHSSEVRDFIEWFGAFQDASGKIPCCADQRGPDPVTENDSHGEFLYLVAEYYRYTGDFGLVRRQWPRIVRTVAHLDSLRAERRTDAYRAPEKRRYFGLLLPSISHEGYPNPMHSYWDDFFAYRGYTDAVYLAGVLGEEHARLRFAAQRDTFATDLAASVAATMAAQKIDYVPGCAELGDFDATSTTIALAPTDAAGLLPEPAVRRTFERYWEFFTGRRDGKQPWDAFTPYETRVIGSFVRLGWRDRANQALDFFLAHRLPPAWKQWPEVAYHDTTAPKYLGDLPHTWVGSDYARSVLDMIAYDHARDSTLVLAAGVPTSWVEGEGLRVRGLRTPYGTLSYTLREANGAIEATVESGLRVPPGGIVVQPPSRAPLRTVEVDGREERLTAEGGVVLRHLPARVVFR